MLILLSWIQIGNADPDHVAMKLTEIKLALHIDHFRSCLELISQPYINSAEE
jgi:hypothetical protein